MTTDYNIINVFNLNSISNYRPTRKEIKETMSLVILQIRILRPGEGVQGQPARLASLKPAPSAQPTRPSLATGVEHT